MVEGRFRVRVMRAGLSLNGNFYPDDVLRAAARLFEGVRVFVKGDREHLVGAGKDVRNLIGRITAPEFVPGAGVDSGEMFGTLELIDPESEIGRKIIRAAERGMLELFGLSIDAEGATMEGTIGGARARIARSFQKINSVDLIVEPGAGGRVVNLVEAAGAASKGAVMDRNQIIELIRSKDETLLTTLEEREAITDADLLAMLAKLLGLPPAATDPGAATPMTEAVMQARLGMMEQLARCSLPDAAKARLRGEVQAGRLTEAALTRRIRDEGSYLASLGFGRGVALPGTGGGHNFREAGGSRASRMLDAFFDPKDRSVTSFRDVYREITGDERFTGMIRNCNRSRMAEALGTDTLDVVLGNSITRRMVAEYNLASPYDLWRDLVTVVPVADFRSQERARWGGYGDLLGVAERAPYIALSSPNDEKASYAVSKRGGLETLSLEAITNDDVGFIQAIPRRLAMAAKRTISKFVFDMLRTNPVIYDTKALFHADHGNLGSAALSAAAVEAGRLAMKNQRELDSNEKIGIGPRYLWVPDVLERTAFDLFQRGTNIDRDYVQSLQLDVRPVWCWTDANDWCLTAETSMVPFIELGFLGGQEEPEILIQDRPDSGSMFSNDILTYKIRHIYGGTVTDYRGAYKSVVP